MLRNLRKIIKNQGGFTLMEMVIGVALIGIIGGAIATSITQVFTGSNTSSNQMTAINNVRNAGDWIIRDAQQARAWDSPNIRDPLLTGLPMEMFWYEYNPNFPTEEWHKITYSINTTNLTRVEDIGTRIDGVWAVVTSGQPVIVAQNITAATRTFVSTDDINILKVTIISTVGAGSYRATEIRTFEIRMRPQR